jgi:stage V sporulation protein S
MRNKEKSSMDTVSATTATVLKVSAHSRSAAVAGAIAGVIREKGHAEVQAIGAGAVNQATKATAIARGYLALEGIDIVCIPTFADVTIGEQERTAIRFIVEPR